MKAWAASVAIVVFFAIGGWYMWRGDTPTLPKSSAATAATVPSTDSYSTGILLGAALRAKANAALGSTRVLLVGNSIAYYIGPSFTGIANVATFDAGFPTCAFPQQIVGGKVDLPRGGGRVRLPCDLSWEPDVVRVFEPAVVLWLLDDPPHRGGTYHGRKISPCSSTYASLYDRDLRAEIARLAARGARVVVTTSAYSGLPESDRRATDCQNRAKRTAAARAGAQLVDLAAFVCPHGICRTKIGGAVLRPDGFNYSGAGGAIVARWLAEQIHTT